MRARAGRRPKKNPENPFYTRNASRVFNESLQACFVEFADPVFFVQLVRDRYRDGGRLCVLMRERREQRRAGQSTENIANDLGCAFELWELSTGVDCLILPAVQLVPRSFSTMLRFCTQGTAIGPITHVRTPRFLPGCQPLPRHDEAYTYVDASS